MLRGSLCAALAVVALASGCGDEDERAATAAAGPQLSRAEYQRAISRIESSPAVRDASRLFYELAAGDVGAEECRTGARRFSDAVETIIGDVAALSPPADVADLHNQLLDEARTTSSQLDALAADVEAGAVACGPEWNDRAYGLASTERAAAIIVEYGTRGYRLVLNSP